MFKRIISSIGSGLRNVTRTVASRLVVPGWIGYAASRITDAVTRRPAAAQSARLAQTSAAPADVAAAEARELPANIEIVDSTTGPAVHRAVFLFYEDAIEYCSEIPVPVRIWRVRTAGGVIYIIEVLGSDGDV